MNKLAFISLSLLITLVSTTMLSFTSAAECFKEDSALGDADAMVDNEFDKTEEEQLIQCLSAELVSFEKSNQELRIKVSELEKSVFEGFNSYLPVKEIDLKIPNSLSNNKVEISKKLNRP